jgi:hypothetical protein
MRAYILNCLSTALVYLLNPVSSYSFFPAPSPSSLLAYCRMISGRASRSLGRGFRVQGGSPSSSHSSRLLVGGFAPPYAGAAAHPHVPVAGYYSTRRFTTTRASAAAGIPAPSNNPLPPPCSVPHVPPVLPMQVKEIATASALLLTQLPTSSPGPTTRSAPPPSAPPPPSASPTVQPLNEQLRIPLSVWEGMGPKARRTATVAGAQRRLLRDVPALGALCDHLQKLFASGLPFDARSVADARGAGVAVVGGDDDEHSRRRSASSRRRHCWRARAQPRQRREHDDY